MNPKSVWKYVASQTKVKQAVGGLLKPDGYSVIHTNMIIRSYYAITESEFFGSYS